MTSAMAQSDIGSRLGRIASRTSGQVSVCARNLTTGEEVALDPDTVLPTASVIKLPILMTLFSAVAAGEVSLDARMDVGEQDRVGGSGILSVFDEGLTPTIRDAAVLMIVLSDNTATNMILRALGGTVQVNALMERLGLATVRLHNRVDFEAIGDDVRRFAEASPRELCTLSELIARRKFLSTAACEGIEAILEKQHYLDQVPRYMRVNPYWRDLGQQPSFRLGCKTGFFPGTWVDAGIVRFGALAHRILLDRERAWCAV